MLTLQSDVSKYYVIFEYIFSSRTVLFSFFYFLLLYYFFSAASDISSTEHRDHTNTITKTLKLFVLLFFQELYSFYFYLNISSFF